MEVFTPRMLTTPRGRFHLREAGSRNKKPLLLLHGWPESGYCWAGVAQSLYDHFHMIVPDLRGLGDSERTLDDSAYTKQALARDMLALLDTLGVRQCVVAGHDWGGAVAQEMALTASARITQLILLNILVLPNTRGNQAARQALSARGAGALWYQFFQSAPGLPEAMIPGNEHAWLGYFLTTWRESGFPKDALEEYVRCYSIEHTPTTGAAYYRSYKHDTRRWAEIAGTRFSMPSLYIYGRYDPVIVPEFTAYLDDVFDNIRVEELESSHFVQEELPEQVAYLIREFVEENA